MEGATHKVAGVGWCEMARTGKSIPKEGATTNDVGFYFGVTECFGTRQKCVSHIANVLNVTELLPTFIFYFLFFAGDF